MGFYRYVKEAWHKPRENMPELSWNRLIQWRQEPTTVRIERPTRIDRARTLGYRAKQGFILVRQRVNRSRRMRPNDQSGRRPKHNRRRLVIAINHQHIAEKRAARRYVNCEVLNSYEVLKDGKNIWYEVILVDKNSPSIRSDPVINWICEPQHNKRAFRGLTSSGRKGRGLRNRGQGAEKARPSKRANDR